MTLLLAQEIFAVMFYEIDRSLALHGNDFIFLQPKECLTIGWSSI
uniref:Uncharacterized protein n=1 Tax=Arundo donax TaxID=35708 RepID=A0A0A9HDR0_ARUDO